jgi:hypothetical protein
MVGSDEGGGGVLQPFQERNGGCREAVSTIQPREEDDRAEPACRRERAGWAGWTRQRLRPSGRWRQWPNGRRKGSGLAEVQGEAGRGWANSETGPEFKKEILFEFQLILEFDRTLKKLYKEI